jgi:hypothetical protein
MRLTVTSHLTLDGVMQSNEKPSLQVDSRLTDGWQTASDGLSPAGLLLLGGTPAVSLRYPWPMRSARLLLT